MAERTDQRTRDSEVDLDADFGSSSDGGGVDTDFGSVLGTDEDVTATATDTGGGGIRGRVGQRVDSIFSVRTFTIALLVTVILSFVAGAVVPIVPSNISGLLGVFAGAFGIGLVSEDRHYLEIGAATLMTGAVTSLLGNLTLTLLGAGVPLVAFGAGASGLAGLAGHYFGRDLRAGLTEDI